MAHSGQIHFTMQNLRPKYFNKLIIFAWLLWKSDQQKCPAPQYLHDVLAGNCKYQVLSDVLITAEKININAMRDKSYIS